MVERIRQTLPYVRILVILRHPVDQAYSRYLMHRRDGHEPAASFEEALAHEQARGRPDPSLAITRRYIYGAPSYAQRLAYFVDGFPREDVRILRFEALQHDPADFMREVYGFLGVDTGVPSAWDTRRNPGGEHRFRFLAQILNRPNPIRGLARHMLPTSMRERGRDFLLRAGTKPAARLDPTLRAQLTRELDGEIRQLERVSGLDLTDWRAEPVHRPDVSQR